jgi:mono/diheme cytochrome c family protein
MRQPLFLTLLVAAASALPVAALAQPGERAAGRRLATEMCGECHQVRPNVPVLFQYPPSFQDIARLPSTTRLSLNVFLRSNHKSMPNFIIAKPDADNIIEYILSLKRQ